MKTTSALRLGAPTGSIAAPRNDGWQVGLDAPARTAMTDFSERHPVTVDPKSPVDAALEVMKHAGVRSAFVLDEAREQVLGFITAHDILGEKPIQFLQSIGCTHLTCTRDDAKVENVMEPVGAWQVVHADDLAHATIASVLEAFARMGERTHLPVVAVDGGALRLRGVFSRPKLLRLTRQARAAAEHREAGRPGSRMAG